MRPGEEDLICDGWTEISRNLAAKLERDGLARARRSNSSCELREIEDYKAMERLRRRVDEYRQGQGHGRGAEALVPLPVQAAVLQRRLSADLQPPERHPGRCVGDRKGVERITETGLVANGVEYEVDCIIYASGFEITTELKRRFGIDVIEGRDGLSLYDHWADGFRTLHGMTTHGFPNQFFTGFTQAGVSANTTAMFEQQGSHIALSSKKRSLAEP